MALAHATPLRNTFADAYDDAVNAGTTDAGGDLHLLDDTTTLVVIQFEAPAHGDASSGQVVLNGVPLENDAVASGTVDKFEIRSRDNDVVLTGTVTGSGGGGDLEISNTSIASGQPIRITALTYDATP